MNTKQDSSVYRCLTGPKITRQLRFRKTKSIIFFGFIILKGLKGIFKHYSDFSVKRSNSPFNCLGLENINLDFIVKVFLNTLASKLAKSEGITEGKHKTAKKKKKLFTDSYCSYGALLEG